MDEMGMRRGPRFAHSQWLTVLPSATRFAFFGDARARAAALPVWGVAFCEDACRANRSGSRATLWLGPDEYLLLDLAATAASTEATTAAGAPSDLRAAAPAGAPSDALAGALESSLAGIPHALVDISHRQFAVQVHGPHAATILNGACPLDLDLAAFPIGMCTRTVLAKADVVLWRTQADAFHLEIWRSFAGYVSGVLAEIGTEFKPR